MLVDCRLLDSSRHAPFAVLAKGTTLQGKVPLLGHGPATSGKAPKMLAMADPVAIISVVSGATVAIGVPFINARLEQHRLRQQSLDVRLTELRELLDGAVQYLFKAYWNLFDIGNECRKKPGGPEWSPTRLRQLGEALNEEAQLLPQYGLRVGLRIPAGEQIAEKQGEANRIVLDYEAAYRAYLEDDRIDQERPPSPPADKAFDSIIALQEEIRVFIGVVAPSGRGRAASSKL